MKIKYALVLLLLLAPLLYSFKIDGTTCYCNSCEDCTSALNGHTCKKVILDEDIYQVNNSVCFVINSDVEGKSFSCNEHNVTADINSNSTGMVISGSNNLVELCSFSNFVVGISVLGEGNKLYGIFIENAKSALPITTEKNCLLESIEINFSDSGITLISSDSCILKQIKMSNLNRSITLITSKNIRMSNLSINKSQTGIQITENSLFSSISNSTFRGNNNSLIISSDYSEVSHSNFTRSTSALVLNANEIKVHDSYFKGNDVAIYFKNSRDNKIYNNVMRGGILFKMENSFRNYIYNNIINSTKPFDFVDVSRAFWNTTYSKKINILNLSAFGGNYWLDPEGKGYSETCKDSDSNGICDEPYKINRNNFDFLPLTIPADLEPPSVEFVLPTPENSSIIFSKNLSINVTATDNSRISMITISLHRIDGSFYTYSCIKNNSCFYTFDGLKEGAYFINATAYDRYNNVNSTPTILVYLRTNQDSFSYSLVVEKYFPLAVIIALIAVIIKQIVDISIMFLKRIEK